MGVDSLPKTVTRQRRGCDLNPGPSAPESSTLTTRQPSHPYSIAIQHRCMPVVSQRRRGAIQQRNTAGVSVTTDERLYGGRFVSLYCALG